MPAWTELTDNERRFAARLMEAFAAFLEHTDEHLGRYVDALRDMGQFDNTVFIAMSDNGASQEGGRTGVLDEMLYFNGMTEDVDRAVERLDLIGTAESHTNYPWGWAMAGNTPLKRYKQNTHAGGVRDPFIVHWPAGILGAGRNGAIVARGSSNGGFVLYVRDRRLVFDDNHFHAHTAVVSDVVLLEGPCTVGVRMDRDGKSGHATLLLEGVEVGSVHIPRMAAMVSSTGMDVSRSQAPVCDDYAPPFVFEGRLSRVVFDIAARTPKSARREALATERKVQGQQ